MSPHSSNLKSLRPGFIGIFFVQPLVVLDFPAEYNGEKTAYYYHSFKVTCHNFTHGVTKGYFDLVDFEILFIKSINFTIIFSMSCLKNIIHFNSSSTEHEHEHMAALGLCNYSGPRQLLLFDMIISLFYLLAKSYVTILRKFNFGMVHERNLFKNYK